VRARHPDPSLERLQQVMSGRWSPDRPDEAADRPASRSGDLADESGATTADVGDEPIWAVPGSGWVPPAPFGTQVRAILASRVPAHLPRIQWNPGRRVVVAIGLIGIAAVSLSVGLLVRGQSHQVLSAAPVMTPTIAALPPIPTAPPTNPSAEVVVDVEGKVAHPGVKRLAAGSRVHDALTAAGGALPAADTTSLDLARLLVDGEQLRVDLPGTAVGPAVDQGPSGASGSAPVNLNSATVATLDALPGVGPVTAQHILDWRSKHGRFTSVGQLLEVAGIGPATYERLAPLVTV
jgi:competence protein ComEA